MNTVQSQARSRAIHPSNTVIHPLWQEADLFVVSASSSLDQKNHLVMNTPMLRSLQAIFTELSETLGSAIREGSRRTQSGFEYNFLVSPSYPKGKLGLLQTAYQWDEDIPLATKGLLDLVMWTVHLKPKTVVLQVTEVVRATAEGIVKDFANIHLIS